MKNSFSLYLILLAVYLRMEYTGSGMKIKQRKFKNRKTVFTDLPELDLSFSAVIVPGACSVVCYI